jgi:hypothetical protein
MPYPSTPYSRMLWRIYRAHTFAKDTSKRDLEIVRSVFEAGALATLKLIAVMIENGHTKEVVKELKRVGRDLKVFQAELERPLRLH